MPFSGLAVYQSGFFPTVAEDVSDVVSMISPYETPLLDAIGDSMYPATSVFHEWLEDALGPNAIQVGAATIATGGLNIAVQGGLGQYLQKGMLLRAPGGEYLQVQDIAGPNTITVNRSFGGTTAEVLPPNAFLIVVSDASNDGADVLVDISRTRPRTGNYTQIFKKDVIVAGTTQALKMLGGIESELDYQIQQRLREALRDLEKAAILGILSGNTIGSSTQYGGVRTMKGLLSFINTNVDSYTHTSASPSIDFEDAISDTIKKAWLAGGTDLDLVLCGNNVKKYLDKLNASRVRVVNEERRYSNVTYELENTYGVYRIMLNRWMPANELAVISTKRIAVAPLQGRSFHYEPVARTGDADKGMVLGEYTMEVRNQNGMCRVQFPNLGWYSNTTEAAKSLTL